MSKVASSPSMRAAPRKSGTRTTRILAIAVSNTASRKTPAESLTRQASTPQANPAKPAAAPSDGTSVEHGKSVAERVHLGGQRDVERKKIEKRVDLACSITIRNRKKKK